jgi:integrating conjugative element protein (TIGR03746 family)
METGAWVAHNTSGSNEVRRYRYEIDNVRAHLRSLWIVIGLQFVVIAGFWLAWMRLPGNITVHVPPDLRSGAVLSLNEIPPANVYTFAFYILQQLNRWPDNGSRDYGKTIYRLSAYMTPKFRSTLIEDMRTKARLGELASRTRSLQAVAGVGFSSERVEIVSADQWIVWLDLDLTESVEGMTVKQTRIRYPLLVVRYAVDAESNPWGLALAGYAGDGPQRISAEESK